MIRVWPSGHVERRVGASKPVTGKLLDILKSELSCLSGPVLLHRTRLHCPLLLLRECPPPHSPGPRMTTGSYFQRPGTVAPRRTSCADQRVLVGSGSDMSSTPASVEEKAWVDIFVRESAIRRKGGIKSVFSRLAPSCVTEQCWTSDTAGEEEVERFFSHLAIASRHTEVLLKINDSLASQYLPVYGGEGPGAQQGDK